MHCCRFTNRPLTRREMLGRCAGGFGAVALSALLADQDRSAALAAVAREGHPPIRAKSVIMLYMDGGVSQVDSFDYKPRLARDNGKPFADRIEPTQFNDIGATLGSPWKFAQRGQSGAWASDLFPHMAECVDELAIVRSMVSEFPEHQTANFFLHTGAGRQGFPSLGAWVSYGLGTENADLPGFVVINGGLTPSGGPDNFGAGFLPATYQATPFKPQPHAVANLEPAVPRDQREAREEFELLRALDAGVAARYGGDAAIESAIASYELAFRMQATVPELVAVDKEPAYLLRQYGFEEAYEPTRTFARECLLARRMVERGVRFVELTCPNTGNDRWDAHSNLKKNHSENAQAVDRPIAALLRDLKQRGLLSSTLVVWAGEFGRTPFSQGADGRDHNPLGFTVWLAGGGTKGGTVYGATDEFGYRAIENRVTIHDLHATILHLLGLDHTRLTFRFGGRDMRLTDVHGEVVQGIIA